MKKKLAIKLETIRDLEHVQGGAGKWQGPINPFEPRPKPQGHSLQRTCGILCVFAR